MIRDEKNNVYYTQDDKEWLTMHPITEEVREELIGKERSYIPAIAGLTISVVILLVFSVIYPTAWLSMIAGVYTVFVIFLIMLLLSIRKTNRKYRKLLTHYLEVRIVEKLPREDYVDGTLTPGSDISTFFPVRATDIVSEYQTILYLPDWKDYQKAEPGQMYRMAVPDKDKWKILQTEEVQP